MIWFKCWCELRARLIFCTILLLPMCLPPILSGSSWLQKLPNSPDFYKKLTDLFEFHMVSGPLTGDRLQFAWWQAALTSIVLVLPSIAYLLAGAGVNTQTLWNKTIGGHNSVLFTLSLPVSRRRWLLTRAGLGALALSPFPLVGLLLVAGGGYLAGYDVPLSSGLRFLPFLYLGSFAFYCLAVQFAAWLGEFWQGVVFVFAQTSLIALVASGATPALNIYRFMAGGDVLYGPASPWPGVLLCLGICIGSIALASWAIERREF